MSEDKHGETPVPTQPDQPPEPFLVRYYVMICFLVLPVFCLFLPGFMPKATALTGTLVVFLLVAALNFATLFRREMARPAAAQTGSAGLVGRLLLWALVTAFICVVPMSCTYMQIVYSKTSGSGLFAPVTLPVPEGQKIPGK